MKKFRFIIAAALALCFMQGVRAVNPGGALGAGGKSVQARTPSEGKLAVESTVAAPLLDETQPEPSIDVIVEPAKSLAKPQKKIGKQGSEAQSNSEYTDLEFANALLNMLAEKEMLRQAKDAVAEYRLAQAQRAPEAPVQESWLWLALLPLLLPPLAVYLRMGGATSEFWLSIPLTLLFVVPGMIYALYVVLSPQ